MYYSLSVNVAFVLALVAAYIVIAAVLLTVLLTDEIVDVPNQSHIKLSIVCSEYSVVSRWAAV